MASPIQLAGQSLIQAHLEIVAPRIADPIIPLRFNPTEYQLQKGNTFAEIPIPGLESPPIQYIRGASEKLTAEVLVDTSATVEDMRIKNVNKLLGLLTINPALHLPPTFTFFCASYISLPL